MAFEDIAARLAPGFDLPVNGVVYHVPPPNAEDGIWLQALMDGLESVVLTAAVGKANRTVLSDEKERTAYQVALGSAHDRMVADQVPWPVLKAAGMAAVLYWTRSAEAAERYWAAQGKAPTTATADPPPTSGATPPEGPSTPSQD